MRAASVQLVVGGARSDVALMAADTAGRVVELQFGGWVCGYSDAGADPPVSGYPCGSGFT